jgi:hypothetical protein
MDWRDWDSVMLSTIPELHLDQVYVVVHERQEGAHLCKRIRKGRRKGEREPQRKKLKLKENEHGVSNKLSESQRIKKQRHAIDLRGGGDEHAGSCASPSPYKYPGRKHGSSTSLGRKVLSESGKGKMWVVLSLQPGLPVVVLGICARVGDAIKERIARHESAS